MKRIEFKAYGGTGSLLARSFITLMALNTGNLAGEEHKDDKCVIYVMDYDDVESVGMTDAKYLDSVITSYNKLHSRGLNFLAPIAIEKSSQKLKAIRSLAYGPNETEYSLSSLFCRGTKSNEIKELLTAAFTSDPSDSTRSAELERSNCDGCYGDLAVNGFISERLIVKKAFQTSSIYNDVLSVLDDAIIIYAGSTDGGTANTMIDKDIESFINACVSQGRAVDTSRKFKIYGLRTTPYSRFELRGDDIDIAITKDILRDKFEMSKGVFENIQQQNKDAEIDPSVASYYRTPSSKNYWLDGLFVGSSSTLDLTSKVAKKDQQFHPSHIVEFSLAQQAMDAIAKRISTTSSGLYAYNDGADESKGDIVTPEEFFKDSNVNYCFKYNMTARRGDQTYSLAKYFKAILYTLVTVKSDMIPDFANPNAARKYVEKVFHGVRGAASTACPLIAAELNSFLEESKFIVTTLMNVMDYSKFNRDQTVIRLADNAMRYLYNTDIYGNAVQVEAGKYVFVRSMSENQLEIVAGARTGGSILTNFHEVVWEPGGLGGKKLSSYDIYRRAPGTAEEKARNVANEMIQRLFEYFLGKQRA